MYIEASSPRKRGDNAMLGSVVFKPSICKLRFFYHMYGSHIGTLNVYTRSSTTGPLNKIWTKTGNQGDKWLKATASISVSQNFQVSAADKLIWSLTSDKQKCQNKLHCLTVNCFAFKKPKMVTKRSLWLVTCRIVHRGQCLASLVHVSVIQSIRFPTKFACSWLENASWVWKLLTIHWEAPPMVPQWLFNTIQYFIQAIKTKVTKYLSKGDI